MQMKLLKNVLILFVILLSLLSCENSGNEPIESESNRIPIFSSNHPNIPPPRIYIPFDFSQKTCGITIIDTILKAPPGSINVIFSTLSGDLEQKILGVILATYDGNYTGFSGAIPFINSQGTPTRNNGILEINPLIDKVSVKYDSFNDKKTTSYSIAITDTAIFYPLRWKDRLP